MKKKQKKNSPEDKTIRIQLGGRLKKKKKSIPGLKSGAAMTYKLLPELLAKAKLKDSVLYWRIEIHGLPGKGPLGLDLIGDVVVGRGPNADLDLDEYSAYLDGVSRKHLILRPTAASLSVLDLKSTNGTSLNNKSLKPWKTYAVTTGSTIGIGNMTLQINLISLTTLGQLRENLLDATKKELKAGKIDKKLIETLSASKGEDTGSLSDDDSDTLMMHFRNMIQYPDNLAEWMNRRHIKR